VLNTKTYLLSYTISIMADYWSYFR